jgi:hypothetical protein
MVEENKMGEQVETTGDLNHFDTKKYSEFIKDNISSVLDETYNTTFRKLIEKNINSIMSHVHKKMSHYIYEDDDIEVDLDSEEYKSFTHSFESKLSKNITGCWCGGDTELKRCTKSIIVRTINMYIEKYRLIYIKHIDLPYRSSDSNITKDIYIYVFSSKIMIFQFRTESRTESDITMYSYPYEFVSRFIIDIFNLVSPSKRDSHEYPIDIQILTPRGFDLFMNQFHLLLKKFEKNPFYFVSGNSRFHRDIIIQKKQLEQQLELLKKQKDEFELEKQKISHIVNIDSKLEEIKIENFKRLKILKKIKQEKMLLQEERKKLEELKESLNISDIELDEEL